MSDILRILVQVLNLALALTLSPLLLGVINRVKAVFAGRVGPPLLQPYYDLWKLLHKGAVYSETTTWVFRAGPVIGLAALLAALLLVPFGNLPGLVSFPGDFLLLAYLLGLARFFIVVSALDTGSSFEGMGASREVFFSMLAEPALMLGLAAVARETTSVFDLRNPLTLSLGGIHNAITPALWSAAGLTLVLVTVALVLVILVENSRIPFDDPNTHLELTMIHEVMVLDHSGPDFAFILYGAALKLWLLGALLVGILLPSTTVSLLDTATDLVAMFGLAVLVGVVESSMARLRLLRVPQLLVGAVALAALAFALGTQRGLS
jgi:formate hydrogenlyase subunit 4